MLKNKFAFFIFVVVLSFATNIFGQVKKLPNVKIYVESFDKTLASGSTIGKTFKDALEYFTELNKINLVYSQNGKDINIHSVNQISDNKFLENDGWSGFIKRKNYIIEKDDYLLEKLEENDQIFVYYGKKGHTQKISQIDLKLDENLLSFYLKHNYFLKNELISKPVQNVKIFVGGPLNFNKVLFTGENGKAYVKLDKAGVYDYFIMDKNNKYPNVVKTDIFCYVYGPKNEKYITREEATAILVNVFEVKGSPGKPPKLKDFGTNNKFYKEINTALSQKIISGYEDGTFRGDEKINLLQVALIIGNIIPNSLYENYSGSNEYEEIPPWARSRISKVLESGILEGVNLDWNSGVNSGIIEKIYRNKLELGF